MATAVVDVVFVCDSVRDDQSGTRQVTLVPAKDQTIQWGTSTSQGAITATGPKDALGSFTVGAFYQFDITPLG